MAYANGPQIKIAGLTAGGSITQYRFVKLSAAQTVIQCDGTTDKPLGVAQDTYSTGDAVEVVCIGVTKVDGDADLSYGSSIGTSADGQAAAYTVSDTTKYIVGQVILDNSAAGGKATAVVDCANARTLA